MCKQFKQKKIEPEELRYYATLVNSELESAMSKFPEFPCDVVHAVAIMAEEAGESTRASLQVEYDELDVQELKDELIQTMAMCVRVLSGLESNNIKPNKVNS